MFISLGNLSTVRAEEGTLGKKYQNCEAENYQKCVEGKGHCKNQWLCPPNIWPWK
jgi:hypothetical protein